MKEIIFLIVLTLSATNKDFDVTYHEMPSWEQCMAAANGSKAYYPTSGDAEAAVVFYCARDKGITEDMGDKIMRQKEK